LYDGSGHLKSPWRDQFVMSIDPPVHMSWDGAFCLVSMAIRVAGPAMS